MFCFVSPIFNCATSPLSKNALYFDDLPSRSTKFLPNKALPRKIRARSDNYAKNVNKRGNVPIGKAAEHEKEVPPPKHLVILFFVLVVGSFLVQLLNLSDVGKRLFPDDDGAASGGPEDEP